MSTVKANTIEPASGGTVTITGAALTTPALGTAASGTLTNCTGLPASTGLSGTTLASNVVNASINAITPSGGTLAVTGSQTVTSTISAAQFQATGGAPGFSISDQAAGGARGQFVNSGGAFYFGIDNSSGGLSGAYQINYFYTGNYDQVWSINSAEKMRLTTAGSLYNVTGTYGTISDAKLKRDVTDTGPKLPKVLAMRIVNYFLIADPTNTKLLGMIAQELREISPGLVDETPDYEVVEVEPARTDHIPRQRQKTEARTVTQWKVEVRDGVAVRSSVEVIEHVPLFIELPLVGEDGQQIIDVVDGQQVQKMHRVPLMENYTETVNVPAVIESRATGTVTLSIKYSVLVPMLVKAMQEMHADFDTRLKALEV